MSEHDAIGFARHQTRVQVLTYYIAMGLFHVVEQRSGSVEEADAWTAEYAVDRHDRTPSFFTWIGFPLWGFCDENDALAFKMRWG